MGMRGRDMRSPLGVIVTTASYLTKLNAGSEVSVAASRLIRSGARIQALVKDLVDFSRTQLGVGINVTPARVDLASSSATNLSCSWPPTRGAK
jgi:signal transduction histidine kinase